MAVSFGNTSVEGMQGLSSKLNRSESPSLFSSGEVAAEGCFYRLLDDWTRNQKQKNKVKKILNPLFS